MRGRAAFGLNPARRAPLTGGLEGGLTPLILYTIGAIAFGYGWYIYWRTGHVGPDPFVLASVCVVSAAGIQVVRDLWQRFLRRFIGRR